MYFWQSDIERARKMTRHRQSIGRTGPLMDKFDADEWRIRRRIWKRRDRGKICNHTYDGCPLCSWFGPQELAADVAAAAARVGIGSFTDWWDCGACAVRGSFELPSGRRYTMAEIAGLIEVSHAGKSPRCHANNGIAAIELPLTDASSYLQA